MNHIKETRPEDARRGEICEHDRPSIVCPNCNSEFMIELPLLDIEHLAEIESLESFRPGLREQMLTLFTGSARSSVSTCDSAWKSEDNNGLAMAAHRLKGSAASLGATRLRDLAARLESDAQEGQKEVIDANRMEELDTTLEETILAYRRWLEC